MGDLNVDYLNADGRSKLDLFCRQRNLHISEHGPTRGGSQIDHILVPDVLCETWSYSTQTFRNFYSDHQSVSIRLRQKN